MFLTQSSTSTSYVFKVNASDSITHKYYSSIAEGMWTWKVMAFNGLAKANSSTWQFTICHPGFLGNPYSLQPSANHFFISSVDMSWLVDCLSYHQLFFTPLGNDHCNETKTLVLSISGASLSWSTTLSYYSTGYSLTSTDCDSMLVSRNTYYWSVITSKHGNTTFSNSTFIYCKPVAQAVVLLTPGLFLFSQIRNATCSVILKWNNSFKLEFRKWRGMRPSS